MAPTFCFCLYIGAYQNVSETVFSGRRALVFLMIFSSEFLFLKVIFNWRITVLQSCLGFSHTTMQISHKYTYVFSVLNLLPTPSPPKSTDFYLLNDEYHCHLFFSVGKQSPGLNCLGGLIQL